MGVSVKKVTLFPSDIGYVSGMYSVAKHDYTSMYIVFKIKPFIDFLPTLTSNKTIRI